MNKDNKIFKNQVKVDNNLKYYYGNKNNTKSRDVVEDKKIIRSDIDVYITELMKTKKFFYTNEVVITTSEKEYNTRILQVKEDKVLTIDNDLIPINEIISIREV